MQRLVYLAVLLFLVLFASSALAHTLIVFADDNEDGTVTIEAVYSTQEIPVFAEVRLEDDKGKVLWKGKIEIIYHLFCFIKLLTDLLRFRTLTQRNSVKQ